MKNTKICVLGGGHGLSNLLKGLKEFSNLNVIVAVTNSGGSTGKIRSTFSCPAMGDIRLNLTILGKDKLNDIFEYRIPKYKDCVGNLIITSLIKLYSFDEAIKICHDILGVPELQKVIPISLDNFDICGEYLDGTIAKQETDFLHEDKLKEVWIEPKGIANSEAIEAIKESDIIIIAPGSFYTSIITNLLINGIAKEIDKKQVIWIANLMQQKGETIGMTLQDHYNILTKYTHIDVAIVNNSVPNEKVLDKEYEGYLTPLTGLETTKTKIIKEQLIDTNNKESITHDSNKLYNIIKEL